MWALSPWYETLEMERFDANDGNTDGVVWEVEGFVPDGIDPGNARGQVYN